MKRIFTRWAWYALLILPFFSFAQSSISPDVNSAYCPGQTITFTVTLPIGTNSSVTGVTGVSLNQGTYSSIAANVTGQPTNITFPTNTTMKFNFTGQFYDDNTPQSFQVTAWDGNTNTSVAYNFTYTKIESFKYAFPNVSKPVTNPASITAPPCSVNTYNISIPTGAQFAINPTGTAFGTISQYQYLLPAGWSLGGTTSTGSNWITAGNSVYVTSDASSGNGAFIYVRALHPCSPALIQGPQAQIAISRPGPSLSLTGIGTSPLCVGSTTSYTVNGVPAGSTVTWSTNPAGLATFASNAPTTTVTGAGTGIGTVKATVTDGCGNATTVSQAPVTFGAVGPQDISQGPTTNYDMEVFVNDVFGPSTTFNWYANNVLQSGQHSSECDIAVLCGHSVTVGVEAVTACGTSSRYSQSFRPRCTGGGGSFSVSPNPATNVITIGVKKDAAAQTVKGKSLAMSKVDGIDEISLFDAQGKLRKHLVVNGSDQTTLDVSGLNNGMYMLEIRKGAYTETQQVVIRK
jgi:hypothetical protein